MKRWMDVRAEIWEIFLGDVFKQNKKKSYQIAEEKITKSIWNFYNQIGALLNIRQPKPCQPRV